MNKEQTERLAGLVDELFHIVGGPSIEERLEQTDRIEEAITQAIDEATPDGVSHGVVIVALANVLAQRIVVNCIKEPPEVPAAMVSLAAAHAGLKNVVEALTHFVSHAVRDAEANGATVVLRFREAKTAAPGATETAPSTAPGASGGVRDAAGTTEPGSDPVTDETTFGGTRAASGTEG